MTHLLSSRQSLSLHLAYLTGYCLWEHNLQPTYFCPSFGGRKLANFLGRDELVSKWNKYYWVLCYPNQQLEGSLSGNTLSGYWTKNSSGRRCTTAYNGSFYWGRIRFVFDGSTFSGGWGHCGDEPTKQWTGSRLGEAPTVTPPAPTVTPSVPTSPPETDIGGKWRTSFGLMDLSQNGTNITGYYSNPSQQLEGSLSGNTLSGYWTKTNTGRRCTTAYKGNFYWGRIRFVFDGSTFSGGWGHCGDDPTKQWTGNRL